MRSLAIGILLIVTYALATKVRYDDYTVYSISPKNEETLNKIKSWRFIEQCDFWTPATHLRIPIDVMVPANIKNNFEKMVQTLNIDYEVKIKNVQELVERQSIRRSGSNLTFSWDAYYTLEEIHSWLNSLPSQYPQVATVFSAGKSYEQRDLLGVKVSFSPDNANRGVFIEANIHAREWISYATSTYILNQILSSQDADFRSVIESFDWYILPVANPDGYEYTHTTERFWRKTRVPHGQCYGADPNRNWDFYWNQGGSDTNPCSDIYAGPSAFSEPSTAALSQYLSGIANNLVSYIDFHSYSQLLMVPFGNTSQHLSNYDVTYPLGLSAAESLARRYGTQYTVGNIAETIYVATGSSLDWLKDKFNVPYCYVYELRDTGRYGFVLPPELIIPTGEETLDSIVTILQGILQNKAK